MIETRNLIKTFKSQKNNVDALRGVSVKINEGDIYGVIGMSGAGKSTLLRCIGLLEPVKPGEVIIDNHDVATLNKSSLRSFRREIGIIFQGYHLYEQKNVWKNVAFPLEIAGAPKALIDNRVKELLDIVGISDKVNDYPSQLSGGQKQRVAIARALANNPKILLCDEPTSALDSLTIESILGLLKQINKELNVTIVIITHEMAVVKAVCNKVTVLDNGLVAETGRVDEVFTNPRSEIARKLASFGGVNHGIA